MVPSSDESGMLMFSKLLHRAVRLWGQGMGGHRRQVRPPVEPGERKRVDVGGLSLSYLHWPGPEPALVLLHGLNNNAWSWAHVASQLQGERGVLAVNLRGHGGSGAPERGYALEDNTRDLTMFLGRVARGPVDLAGHSFGGKVASHLAATRPHLVRSLMLADPVLPRGLNPFLRALPRAAALAYRVERGPFADRAAWELAGRSIIYLGRWDEMDRRIWEGSFHEAPDGSYHHLLPEGAFQEIMTRSLAQDIEPLVSTIACPVLLMVPTVSISFWPGEIGQLLKILPQVQTKRLKGDHTFIHSNPIDTAEAMAGFLIKIKDLIGAGQAGIFPSPF